MIDAPEAPQAPSKPHAQKALIEFFPALHTLYARFKAPVQLIVAIIILIASQHDAHLASTLSSVGLDVFGDMITLPRELLNIPEIASAAGGITFGGGG